MYLQNRRLTDLDIELMVVVREGIESLGLSCTRCTLLYLKWITKKYLLYSTWNFAQCYVATLMGGVFEGEGIHVCA